jgi:lysophospholipase L1-like esterase
MDEAEIARLGGLREALLHRMATDGLVVVEAPEIPEEGFLDKAHLTPLGCDIMARHLKEALQAAGYIPEPRRHAGRA